MLIPYFIWLVTTVFRSVQTTNKSTTRFAYYNSTAEFVLRYVAAPLHLIALSIEATIEHSPWQPINLVLMFALIIFIGYRQWKIRDRNYWFHGRYSDGQDPWFVRVLRPKTEVSDA